MIKPLAVQLVQATGKMIDFPSSSYLIETLPVGVLTFRDQIVVQDAFWPHGSELMARVPILPTGAVSFTISLSVARLPYQGRERTLVGGVTLSSGSSRPSNWTKLRGPDGDIALVDVDNSSILISDLGSLEQNIGIRSAGDERSLYSRVMVSGFEILGDALIVQCGKGSGSYEIWVGRDSFGSVLEVVIDLETFADGVVR